MSSNGARTSRRAEHRRLVAALTDDDYARLLEAQDGHCALCPATPKTRRLNIDHDHRTMKVRGLLCHRCNRALPQWVTMQWLLATIAYLDHPPADRTLDSAVVADLESRPMQAAQTSREAELSASGTGA